MIDEKKMSNEVRKEVIKKCQLNIRFVFYSIIRAPNTEIPVN